MFPCPPTPIYKVNQGGTIAASKDYRPPADTFTFPEVAGGGRRKEGCSQSLRWIILPASVQNGGGGKKERDREKGRQKRGEEERNVQASTAGSLLPAAVALRVRGRASPPRPSAPRRVERLLPGAQEQRSRRPRCPAAPAHAAGLPRGGAAARAAPAGGAGAVPWAAAAGRGRQRGGGSAVPGASQAPGPGRDPPAEPASAGAHRSFARPGPGPRPRPRPRRGRGTAARAGQTASPGRRRETGGAGGGIAARRRYPGSVGGACVGPCPGRPSALVELSRVLMGIRARVSRARAKRDPG